MSTEKSENPAEEFADAEVPLALRHFFPSALRRAYSAADQTIERAPYLTTPGGKYQRGDLIMLAASFEFEQLIKSNNLPFDGTWEFFARPTGKHFVMLTPRARITTNQIDDPAKRPRHAVFRTNYAEVNSRFLFDDMNTAADIEREKAETDGKRRLLHILHGYQALEFAHIAYPHPEQNCHIYRSPNMMRIPHAITSDLPPAEGPAESPTPEILDNIARHLRDNDD